MKLSLNNIFIVLLIIFSFVFSTYVAMNIASSEKYFDCNLSEISPDYTIKMKEYCRTLRKQND